VDLKFLMLTQKRSILLPFTNDVINNIARHEVYSLLYGFYGYHQISITHKDEYKITFVIKWGAFVWVVMYFGVKYGPPKGLLPKLYVNTLMYS
jgi:hypothetical protein